MVSHLLFYLRLHIPRQEQDTPHLEEVNTTRKHRNLTVRIVNYPWRDESGYINESWNCRKMVNITNETGGTGIVEIRDFIPTYGSSELPYKIMNCSKEIRISEVFFNGSHQRIPYISISDASYYEYADYTYCADATIRFNATLNAGETKSFFVYYNNPLVEIDYQSPSGNTLFNKTYSEINKTGMELSWDGFYDSHLDFVWHGDNFTGPSNWNQSMLSKYRRINTNNTYNALVELNYNPKAVVNRENQSILNTLPSEEFYWFNAHGNIVYNMTWIYMLDSGISSSDIDNLSGLSAKFIELASCYSGDNNVTNTSLTGWFGKSFIERGVDCFLGFEGTLTEFTYNSATQEIISAPFPDFNECFWGNVTAGETIRSAVYGCDVYEGEYVVPKLYNSTANMPDGCNQTL